MPTSRRVLGLMLLISVAGASCGGSGDGRAGSCGKVAPCGGGLVGRWKVVAGCDKVGPLTAAAALLVGCPTLTIDVLDRSTAGTLAFAADGTYSIDLVTSQTLRADLPSSCLNLGGVALTCAEASVALKLALAVVPAVTSVNCVASSQLACACTFGLGPVSTAETGTFSALGSQVSTVAASTSGTASSTSSSHGYCVQGASTLHWVASDLPVSLGPLGTVRIPFGDDLVAARQ